MPDPISHGQHGPRWLATAALALLLAGAPCSGIELSLNDDGGDFDSLLAEMEAEAGGAWWNAAWRFRRKCTLHDPRLAVTRGPVFLSEPEPLLLANTRPCAPALADLRAVALDGQPLPCGVIRFGQDDGYSAIWLHPPQGAKLPFVFYLYYGNAQAEPDGAPPPSPALIPPDGEWLRPVPSPEETAPGVPPLTAPDQDFFDDVVVVEAEDCVTAYGEPSFTYARQPPQMAWRIKRRDTDPNQRRAGAGAYLASTCPWRQQELPEPIVAWTRTELPAAGRWQIHVRYRTTRYYPLSDRGKGGLPTPERFVPFEMMLGTNTFTCGVKQGPGAMFRWDRFEADLPAGELDVRFRMTGPSAPDCVMFKRDPAYRPDHRDVDGPVWMRVKVNEESFGPYYVDTFCFIQPWSSHGPQGESAGYVMRNEIIRSKTDLDIAIRDPEAFIPPGKWSPWVETLPSSAVTWWTHLRFFPRDRRVGKQGAGDMTVQFEFATRPTTERVFRSGTEAIGSTPGLHVIMPRGLGWAELRRQTLSFGQWARRRFEFVQSLGLTPGQGPKEILVTTMSTSVGEEETDYILRTCQMLGFNGIEVRTPLTRDEFVKRAVSRGMVSSTAHHWYPKFGVQELPMAPAKGQTCTDTLKACLVEQSRKCYASERRWGHPDMRVKLLIMGDEIGPATMSAYINRHPLLKGAFHEYLQSHGLSPEFFGRAAWGEVDALDYIVPSPGSESARSIVAFLEAKGLPVDPALTGQGDLPTLPADVPLDIATAESEEGDAKLIDLSAEEEAKQLEARLTHSADPSAPLEEKRLYHWTQRFRSAYTALFFGTASAEIHRRAVELKLPWKPLACPNFQAMPIMCGQMWSGSLNLFEWARTGTTDFLFMEDWINGPYRVAFGQRLLAAAARKCGQTQGHLIVADRAPRQRYLMALANGSRAFLSYLYGPLRVIGPAWAEHETTIRAWADTLAWTARLEDELLASRPRPTEAALLIANTAEINSAYLTTSVTPSRPLNERQHIFAALMDAHVPVELLGEEEIMEDDALDRYRVLFVADPHVDSRAQARIKEWVRGGGVLWASHAGLMREEYDVTTPRFNEVFGLAERGPAVSTAGERPAIVPEHRIRVAGTQGLSAVEFDAYPIRPAWTVGSAQVLARFADNDQPAFLHNRFGAGHAYLLGNSANACTAEYGHTMAEPEWAARARKLVAVAARTADVAPHVALSHARVLWTVKDGPGYSILVLASCADADIEDLEVDVFLPARPTEVLTGRGEKPAFTWHEDRVRVTLDLPQADGEILLLRYGE